MPLGLCVPQRWRQLQGMDVPLTRTDAYISIGIRIYIHVCMCICMCVCAFVGMVRRGKTTACSVDCWGFSAYVYYSPCPTDRDTSHACDNEHPRYIEQSLTIYIRFLHHPFVLGGSVQFLSKNPSSPRRVWSLVVWAFFVFFGWLTAVN